MQLEIHPRTEDVPAEIPRPARLLQCRLETMERFVMELAAHVVVSDRRADGVTGDGHTLDQRMRIEAQDVAILEGPRLALVRVADEITLSGGGLLHEAPLQARREPRATTATQTGTLDLVDDRIGRHLLAQDTFERLVAACGAIRLQAPGALVSQRGQADLFAHRDITPAHPGSGRSVRASGSRGSDRRPPSSGRPRRPRDTPPRP